MERVMRLAQENSGLENTYEDRCPICNDKGYIFDKLDENGCIERCDCYKQKAAQKRAQSRIEKSGLGQLLEAKTLANFDTKRPWNKEAKELAEKFLAESNGRWFFWGGAPGCGKTHLCTAITGEFIKRGVDAKYMVWLDEIPNLKINVNDKEYSDAMHEFKTLPLLYIDDLFKSKKVEKIGKDERLVIPTTSDIRIAMELINHRVNAGLQTIISCEYTIDELVGFDVALGSRIYEQAKDFCLITDDDEGHSKNYRLWGEQ